jgi:hypothetical protein
MYGGGDAMEPVWVGTTLVGEAQRHEEQGSSRAVWLGVGADGARRQGTTMVAQRGAEADSARRLGKRRPQR